MSERICLKICFVVVVFAFFYYIFDQEEYFWKSILNFCYDGFRFNHSKFYLNWYLVYLSSGNGQAQYLTTTQ